MVRAGRKERFVSDRQVILAAEGVQNHPELQSSGLARGCPRAAQITRQVGGGEANLGNLASLFPNRKFGNQELLSVGRVLVLHRPSSEFYPKCRPEAGSVRGGR